MWLLTLQYLVQFWSNNGSVSPMPHQLESLTVSKPKLLTYNELILSAASLTVGPQNDQTATPPPTPARQDWALSISALLGRIASWCTYAKLSSRSIYDEFSAADQITRHYCHSAYWNDLNKVCSLGPSGMGSIQLMNSQ